MVRFKPFYTTLFQPLYPLHLTFPLIRSQLDFMHIKHKSSFRVIVRFERGLPQLVTVSLIVERHRKREIREPHFGTHGRVGKSRICILGHHRLTEFAGFVGGQEGAAGFVEVVSNHLMLSFHKWNYIPSASSNP